MVATYKDRLAEAMRDKGVDTSALAAKLGISYQAVRKVEKGISKSLSADNNSRAAAFLEVRADWLARGELPKCNEAGVAEPRASYDVAADLRAAAAAMRARVQALSASDRRMVAALLASYIGDEDASEHQIEAVCRILEAPPGRPPGRVFHDGLSGPGGRITPEGGLVQRRGKGGAQKK